MKSQRPKVLHHLAGKSMLQHVIDNSRDLGPDQVIVVVGHNSKQVRDQLEGQNIELVEQHKQLGTGHAVAQCLEVLKQGNDVLVLYGDVPMIQAETLCNLVDQTKDAAVGILSFIPENATGYGRIVRQSNHQVTAIVEEKDATAEQKNIKESNSGIMLIAGDQLRFLISKLDNENAQSEYYLTDIVKHAVHEDMNVSAFVAADAEEILGVNNQQQLAHIEALYRQRLARSLMTSGAKLYDPARIDIRGRLNVGSDVVIDVNCIFIGEVNLGNNVCIGANCVIENSTIGDDSTILPMTSIDSSMVGKSVSIGPFARIRPGTECADRVKIGNFVETKKASIGTASKVSHLSYIGDTDMGSGVNVGAGTITCNYDGVNKFKTIIEDNVFIGSDTQLVAPVTLAKGSTIGAGSTITRDTPPEQLTLSRAKQTSIKGWTKPVKKNKD